MWQVEQLRLTAFFQSPVAEPSAVWNRLMGFEAPMMSRVQEGASFLHVFEAPNDKGFSAVRSTPFKVDFLFGNYPQLAPRQDEQLTVDTFTDAVPRLIRMVDTLVDVNLGEASRLAVGAILLQEVADRETGYNVLKPLLQTFVKVDPVGSSDMMFRINRPRSSSSAPGVIVNRVSEWSVGMQVLEGLDVSGGEITLRPGERRTRYLPRVAIDVNNVPKQGTLFSSDAQRALLLEFVELTKEIAQEGDTP